MEAQDTFYFFSAACVVLNAWVLVILFRTNNLKKNRFTCLVLYLSISDMLLGIQTLSGVIFKFIDASKYVCTFIGTLMIATVLFSMYQVLLICIERLNATYSVPNEHLNRMTSNKSVFIGFVFIHVYAIALWLYEIYTMEISCVLTPRISHVILLDTPVILLTVFTIVLYVVIMVRIVRQHKAVHPHGERHVFVEDHSADNLRFVRIKRNLITLGIIVSISSIIAIPRPGASIAYVVNGYTIENSRLLGIFTALMILNPVLDPIIYVLRIRVFRERIKCRICRTGRKNQNKNLAETNTDVHIVGQSIHGNRSYMTSPISAVTSQETIRL